MATAREALKSELTKTGDKTVSIKAFYVVCRQDESGLYGSEFVVLQSKKPVFNQEKAEILCQLCAREGNMDERYAVFRANNSGLKMVGTSIRGAKEI
ncbi:hypothetical protein [Microbulbifer sp. 2205BS26-8]|uniref:hypothetical protein n=1 Tax=Microbulbifer sp. 2205BS26-8 TaxID=3064386 RepID=UPI00273EA6D5|nr:hypothetical protein [Microbulbifer sp. 2205BS26-8]MDP5209841.1 hypothetical protein [Microbulbifer sp. 2205BS26-8]